MGDNGVGNYLNNTSSTSLNPVYNFTSTGLYNVQLILFNSFAPTCNDTISLPVNVWSNPVANFSSNTVCQGDITIFSDLSNQGPNPTPIVS